ncbi:MAG: hybrid sensor histidine kinase/response regulator [Magnetococcales bacterium]|nr:hybrid sensor histidine kinase/response regulator [Magnetococcales bacterium]
MIHINEKPRILIVDDIPVNIKILASALGSDYEISVATRGAEALETAAASAVDLVLLDVVMPDMDGYAVCRALKKSAAAAHIPIIFVTSKNEATDETYALELGAVDFISKPVVPAVVRARVKTHLGLMRALKTLESQNEELRQAEQLREEVDRIMRHDLKSPLNTIIGFADLLRFKLSLNREEEGMFQILQDSGYKLLAMINLSLDLFKMEKGTYTFEAEPVDVVGLVKKICVAGSEMIRYRHLNFKLFLDNMPLSMEETFLVLGEETLCYSMLSNLIQNAVEASPPEQTITVRLDRGAMHRIRIHNQGCIPPQIRENFFDKYVTFGKKNGTGLGVYSARLMAVTQRGTIDFETSEESGTTMCISLPPAIPAAGPDPVR